MGFHGRFCILLPLLAKVCRRRQDTTLLRREYVSVSEKDNFPPSASCQIRQNSMQIFMKKRRILVDIKRRRRFDTP